MSERSNALQRALFRVLYNQRRRTENGGADQRSSARDAPAELREASQEDLDGGAACRFCFEGGPKRLIAPCSCSGSQASIVDGVRYPMGCNMQCCVEDGECRRSHRSDAGRKCCVGGVSRGVQCMIDDVDSLDSDVRYEWQRSRPPKERAPDFCHESESTADGARSRAPWFRFFP